jgi:trehalose-phosphatase
LIEDVGLPGALEHLSRIVALVGRRRPAFFMDFDGTLAPIASTPESAVLPAPMRSLVARLAERHLVCIVSGRGLNDLRSKIGLQTVYYAADHGHHIVGPEGTGVALEVAPQDSVELEKASFDLESRLHGIAGALVETKGMSLSVHYRLVPESEHHRVEQFVQEVAAESPGLRLTTGKYVYELTPDLGWDKGYAVMWLVKRLVLRRSAICPICLGDDMTDEDMFKAVKGWGVGMAVGEPRPRTRADYSLADLNEVMAFLTLFAGSGSSRTAPTVN